MKSSQKGIIRYGSIFNYTGPRVVVVGITSGDEILTGKRRDNKLWTFTAGHVDNGEEIEDAAIREVFEESGIRISSSNLIPINNKFVGDMAIFSYLAKLPKYHATAKNDPDKEVSQWKWVKIDLETPELKRENRHAKEDLICDYLFRGI